jgi:hypothetical protein
MPWQAASNIVPIGPHLLGLSLCSLFHPESELGCVQWNMAGLIVLEFPAQVISGIAVSVLIFGSLTLGEASDHSMRTKVKPSCREAHIGRK